MSEHWVVFVQMWNTGPGHYCHFHIHWRPTGTCESVEKFQGEDLDMSTGRVSDEDLPPGS